MKKISIIMPFLNEDMEPKETIESIYDTAPSSLFKIIAIDDCSQKSVHLDFPDVQIIRNEKRIGVDGSRQKGIELADTPCIFVIDSHMRFKKDNWLEKMIDCVEKEPDAAWCTVCLGLGYGTMDINNHKGKYYGANMLFIDDNATPDRPAREVLEPKWGAKKDGLEFEIPCILGANYAFSKKWFDYIGGLKGLKMWGSSEPFLSMKTWMAGGKNKIRTDVEIGHKFRSNSPYTTKISSLVFNKIFICKTIFPDQLGDKLIGYLPKDINYKKAMEEIDNIQERIKKDRAYYHSIFKRSIYDYCNEFKIKLPERSKGD